MTKNIAIIGAGPGGYETAIRGAQLGANIFLIENREVHVSTEAVSLLKLILGMPK